MISRNPALTPLSLIAALALSAAAGVQPPAGDLRAATLADLKPHPQPSKTYNEFWTYQFYFDNNVQAVLNFSRVNAGTFKSPVCGSDLGLMGFRGKNYVVAREYDRSNFVFDDAQNKLSVHENIWFKGKPPEEHCIHFATTKKGVSYYLDLKFSDMTPGKVWGDGVFKEGGDVVGIFVHIPYAKVKGRLAINNDTMEVSGRAYMDHTYQTDLAPKIVKAGFRYVSLDGPLNTGYYMQPVSGTLPIGYGLKEEGGTTKLLKPARLTALGSTELLDMPVPTPLQIDLQDGTKNILKREDNRYRISFLAEFNWLEKRAIRAVMGGEVKTFKGVGKLDDAQRVSYDFFMVDD